MNALVSFLVDDLVVGSVAPLPKSSKSSRVAAALLNLDGVDKLNSDKSNFGTSGLRP